MLQLHPNVFGSYFSEQMSGEQDKTSTPAGNPEDMQCCSVEQENHLQHSKESVQFASLEAEICCLGLENQCTVSACGFHHYKHPYHWQVRSRGKIWVDLEESQSDVIERHYQDPNVDICEVRALDRSKYEADHPLYRLLSNGNWLADFENMNLMSDLDELPLRRLSTQSSAKSTSVAATTWKWYYMKQDKWEKFELSGNHHSDVSEILETFLMEEMAAQDLTTDTNSFKIDIIQKTAIDIINNVIYTLRRRPTYKFNTRIEWGVLTDTRLWDSYDARLLSSQIEASFVSGKDFFTYKDETTDEEFLIEYKTMTKLNIATWAVSQLMRINHGVIDLETAVLSIPTKVKNYNFSCYKLHKSSREYGLFTEVFARPSCKSISNIVNIFLIKNQSLQSMYLQERKAMLRHFNNDLSKLNERRLFHGTSAESVISICNDNFQLKYANQHGSAFGKGVYFTCNWLRAQHYSTHDIDNYKWMFIVRVLVGTKLEDAPNPGQVPRISYAYETVVKNDIHVKFHENCYYPECLVQFQ